MQDKQVRLFVGGLPSTVSCGQICQRFESFGKVHGVELVPEKEGTLRASQSLQPCRGFAYVQLSPSDEASLRRCISMYNGCRWLGGVLRVEPAKADYKQRLARETTQDQAQEAGKDSKVSQPPGMLHSSGPIHLLSRDGRKVHAVAPNPVKTFFPPSRPLPIEQLSWEPVKQPPGLVKRYLRQSQQLAMALAAPVTSGLGQHDSIEPTGADAPAEEAPSLEAPWKRLRPSLEAVVQPVPQEPSSSSELAAVNFMSSDEDVDQPGDALGSRFDSSDDEGAPALAVQQHSGSTAPSQLPANKRHSDYTDLSAGDHDEKADSHSNLEASTDRTLLQSKHAGRGLAADVESSGAVLQQNDDSSEGASEPSDAANAAADVYDSTPGGDAAAHMPAASVGADWEEEDLDRPEQEPSEAEEGEAAEDAPEPEEDALLVNPMEADDEAEPSSPAGQPVVLHPDNPGWRSEQELPAASLGEGDAPPEDQANQPGLQQEADMLKALGRLFPKGASFHRGETPQVAEAAWLANREAWMADCKTKRRMALRQQSGPKRKMR